MHRDKKVGHNQYVSDFTKGEISPKFEKKLKKGSRWKEGKFPIWEIKRAPLLISKLMPDGYLIGVC